MGSAAGSTGPDTVRAWSANSHVICGGDIDIIGDVHSGTGLGHSCL